MVVLEGIEVVVEAWSRSRAAASATGSQSNPLSLQLTGTADDVQRAAADPVENVNPRRLVVLDE